jgi:hypothetical protein
MCGFLMQEEMFIREIICGYIQTVNLNSGILVLKRWRNKMSQHALTLYKNNEATPKKSQWLDFPKEPLQACLVWPHFQNILRKK